MDGPLVFVACVLVLVIAVIGWLSWRLLHPRRASGAPTPMNRPVEMPELGDADKTPVSNPPARPLPLEPFDPPREATPTGWGKIGRRGGGGGAGLVLLAAVTSFAPAQGCGFFRSDGPLWPAVAQCSANQGAELVDDVGAVLGAGSGPSIGDPQIAELEGLAVKYGAETIACVIEQLVRTWTRQGAQMHAEGRAPLLDAAARGRDFLRRKGVRDVSGGR